MRKFIVAEIVLYAILCIVFYFVDLDNIVALSLFFEAFIIQFIIHGVLFIIALIMMSDVI